MSDQPLISQLHPPVAKREPTERTHHGDTFVDEFAWLAAKDNQETIAFLEAENAYTEARTASQEHLRQAIFGEIKSRTKETDLSVPVRNRGVISSSLASWRNRCLGCSTASSESYKLFLTQRHCCRSR